MTKEKMFIFELHHLLSKYKMTIGVDLEGDTHGITGLNIVAFGKDDERIFLSEPHSYYFDAGDLENGTDGIYFCPHLKDCNGLQCNMDTEKYLCDF
jgi:hypothetical protein